MTTLTLACVGNAGRSQLATAFAERERDRRDLDVEIRTGGTNPKSAVSDDVRQTLSLEGLAVGDREPRALTDADVAEADYLVTMGCHLEDRLPADWDGEHRAWTIEAGGDDLESVRRQAAEIDGRVDALFDDLEASQR